MTRHLRVFAVVSVLAIVAAACSKGGGAGNAPPATKITKGGTLRIDTTSDVLAVMDPQKEYYQISFGLYRCCLLRTLVTYNGLDAKHHGTEVFPDVASAMPTASSDGLTWTFTLKSGLHYAPPLQNVEITAQDFIRALLREGDPAAAAAYGFYYNVIAGYSDYSAGKAKTISGMEAPDPHTLIIHVTQPTGDLPFRFALPATAPIPPNPANPDAPLGVAQGHDDNYGRFLVASGPYMFAGSDAMDFSVPASKQKPVSGYEPAKHMSLVRNPSWSQDTLRKAYVDGLDYTLSPGAEPRVLEQKVAANELDTMFGNGVAPETLRQFDTSPELKKQIFINPGTGNYYLTMNLAVPPFDDIHVRKAVNFAIDKAAYQRLNGGPVATGPAYGHFVIDPDVGLQLQNYNPYATPGNQGADTAAGLASAKKEMAQSKYDPGHTGMCTASECKNVLAIGVVGKVSESVDSLFTQNLAAIGITLDLKHLSNDAAYGKMFDPANKVPLSTGWAGWLHDYPDGYTWFYPIMYGPNILSQYNTNYSMVGASAEQLTKFGYTITSVPGMNSQIEKCFPLSGAARVTCWADNDKYLMTQIVPVVPLVESNVVNIVGSCVVNFTFSAYDAQTAYDQIALKPGCP